MLILSSCKSPHSSLVFVYHLYFQHNFCSNYIIAASWYMCEAETEEGRLPVLYRIPVRERVWRTIIQGARSRTHSRTQGFCVPGVLNMGPHRGPWKDSRGSDKPVKCCHVLLEQQFLNFSLQLNFLEDLSNPDCGAPPR